MSSKDNKDTKGLQLYLKNFFGKHKTTQGNIISSPELNISAEKIKDLRDSPLAIRLKTLKELSSTVLERKMENETIAVLWNAIEDLFGKEYSTETKNIAFLFLQNLTKGQYERLSLMRAQFFRFITTHPEDVGQRLILLNNLTSNGKDIVYFEDKIGTFLLNWLPDITKEGKTQEYLLFIDNVIKFNAAYLDEEVISGLMQYICVLCCGSKSDTVNVCLTILNTMVAYSNMSPDCLLKFIGALCRTATVEYHTHESWKIMKNLLGTHMGHSALYTMCRILQEPALQSDVNLLRGAVFYIHMALWGNQPLTNLHCPPSSVLPAILKGVKSNHPAVAYEAILGIKLLVTKYCYELQDPAWSIILDIISHIINMIVLAPNQVPNNQIVIPLDETIRFIENLISSGRYNGSVTQFYSVIEECASDRSEESVIKLVLFMAEDIMPTEHDWIGKLDQLLNKYLKPSIRTRIRLKVLEILTNVVKLNRMLYEEELIDKIIIPHMLTIDNDTDIVVRAAVAKLLVDLCMNCESKNCLDMLEIIRKLLTRPFRDHPGDVIPANETEHCDIKVLVSGLIKVFHHKIHKLPSSHAIKIYDMFVNFLEQHYLKPKIFEHTNQVRYMIFDCFLTMRADEMYHLGCPDSNGKLRFSSFLCVTYGNDRGPLGSPPPQSPAISQQPTCTVTYVSLKQAFKIFITCLRNEKDWEVLRLVLRETTKCLQNKALILSKQGNNELYILVGTLYSMIDSNQNLPETLITQSSSPISKPSRADFQTAVLHCLVNLASYHSYLDPPHQQKIVRSLMKCIQTGPRSSKQWFTALTICTLEMSEVMVKMLPEVLLSLSKMSATVYVSIPVLEFLSTLTQLPKVFANFVADQYMAVFAISLPYTNPFKYNHYTVSLAHHVIAVWFLKCRQPFRKDFVRFITKGLQTNVLEQFEEPNILKQDLNQLNQDSSDRKRSSSLTEQGPRRRAATVSVSKPTNYKHAPTAILRTDKSLDTFYEELTETCIDLMARYAFSPCSALPKRFPTAEFLLNSGQNMTWLLGNKLITVTTSGCSQKVLKQGLCDKCLTFCNIANENKDLRDSRSGSNENQNPDGTTWLTRQNSGDNKSNNATNVSSPVDENKKIGDDLSTKLQQLVSNVGKSDREICSCWCQGWAEIYVRRPTGNMSWVMRIQNQVSCQNADFPLNEISTLFLPSLHLEHPLSITRQGTSEETTSNLDDLEPTESSNNGLSQLESPPVVPNTLQLNFNPSTNVTSLPLNVPKPNQNQLQISQPTSRQNSREDDPEAIYDDEEGGKSRNPVRRSNSSPEMSANWKSPFLLVKQQEFDDGSGENIDDNGKKGGKMYSKDMRVSCEAIPEEMAGTTPPSNDQLATGPTHPSLLSYHSYPGSNSPPKEPQIQKQFQTVPPSPNVLPAGVNQQPDFQKTSKPRSLDSVNTERPSNLPNLMPLTTKPPQSPTQTSPRMNRHSLGQRDMMEIQKSNSASVIERGSNLSISLARERAKERKSSGSVERLSNLDPNQAIKRDRTHTISVMSPANRKPRIEQFRTNVRSKEAPKSGISPSFVFLQLYHAAHFGNSAEKPLLVSSNDAVQRAVKILDQIPPYETHRIGVIYIREGQVNNETEILKNRFGSLRYVQFLQNLGTLIKLTEVDGFFLGGLDEKSGNDGKFAYIWQDDVIKVTFHVATMMPTLDSEPNCNNKKLHIGNNFVMIVYNESGEEFNINTIKGQFNFASIIIQPLDHNTNKVVVKTKDELKDLISSGEQKIVSDQNVAILARQLALHCNLASQVVSSLKNPSTPYASNWLERFRKFKNVRNKIIQEMKNEESNYPGEENSSNKKRMEDFTDYT